MLSQEKLWNGKKMMKNKKGYYLSLDALVALVIILGIVLFIKPSVTQIPSQPNIQEDILVALSAVTIGEVI